MAYIPQTKDETDEEAERTRRRANLFGGARARAATADQTNVPKDQAEAQQPGSSRIAEMFKGEASVPERQLEDQSSSPATSSTSMVSRPDFTARDKALAEYRAAAAEGPGLFRPQRDAYSRKMSALREAVELEQGKAYGDVGAQQKYAGFFDPKRLGGPVEGRGADSKLKYFQDVFSRDPETGAGKMSYEDTGVEPPPDIRRDVLAHGGAAGGVIVQPKAGGGYGAETYRNEPAPQPLPGSGAKAVPGGYVDAQGTFHKTVEPGQGGAGGRGGTGTTALLNKLAEAYQIGGPAKMKELVDTYRENGVPIDEILATAAQQYQGRGGIIQPGGAPGTSGPPAIARPAAPAGARGRVTPNDAATSAPPGPGGLRATHVNAQGQYAAQGPDGKWVTWGGAQQRGMGR